MKHLFTLLFFGALSLRLTCPVTAQSATGAQQGYIITLRGDTVRGLVQAATKVTENGISFQRAADAPAKTYFPPDIRGFGEQNGRHFISYRMGLVRKEAINTTNSTDQKDSISVFLQPLVRGYATLYRLDYEGNYVEQTALDGMDRRNTYYFLQQNGTRVLALQQGTFKSILQSVFADCPTAAATVAGTKFLENKLAELVLRYNTCHPQLPSRDLRRSASQGAPLTVKVGVGLLGGVNRGVIYYRESKELGEAQLKAEDNRVVQLRLILSTGRPLGFETGLQYMARTSSGSRPYVVGSGYRNAGQELQLPASITLTSMQVPLLVRYSFGRGRVHPFLAGGLLLGGHFNQKAQVSTPTFVTITPPGSGTQGVFEQQVRTERPSGYPESQFRLTYGLRGATGVTVQLGKLVPSVEVHYDLGQESTITNTQGRLYYRGASLVAGLAF